jgi:hypothetical protein
MTRHSFLLALAMTAGLAMPGLALADDDNDATRILRGLVAPQFHGFFWDQDDDRRWEHGFRFRHDDDDDDRWEDDGDDDDDDDDRRGRWRGGDDD